jgi:CRP-like cAMP-binding protein
MCIAGGNIAQFERSLSGEWDRAEGPRTSLRHVRAHDHLFFEGDQRTHLFLVESGWVKLYRTLVDGQRQVVGFANAGSVLGFESEEDAGSVYAEADEEHSSEKPSDDFI